MSNELDELLPFSSNDPDDLAAMICRLLVMQGHRPKAKWRVKDGFVTAIEVWLGERPVAIFPCGPIDRTTMSESLLSLIERGGT